MAQQQQERSRMSVGEIREKIEALKNQLDVVAFPALFTKKNKLSFDTNTQSGKIFVNMVEFEDENKSKVIKDFRFALETHEIMNLRQGLEAYRKGGKEGFRRFAAWVNPTVRSNLDPNTNRVMLTFPHRNDRDNTISQFGLVLDVDDKGRHFFQFQGSRESHHKNRKEKMVVSFPVARSIYLKLEAMMSRLEEASFNNEIVRERIRVLQYRLDKAQERGQETGVEAPEQVEPETGTSAEPSDFPEAYEGYDDDFVVAEPPPAHSPQP